MADLYLTMAKYGWRDIHYSNLFLPGETPTMDNPYTWSIGLYTGPNHTLCVKECSTLDEAQRFASPKGNTISEAITKARILLEDPYGRRKLGIFPRYHRVDAYRYYADR